MFIVVTEKEYGGNEKIMVFSDRWRAETYKIFLERENNCPIIIESDCDTTDYKDKVYVVASEEDYGGDVRIFTEQYEATYYADKLLDKYCINTKIIDCYVDTF